MPDDIMPEAREAAYKIDPSYTGHRLDRNGIARIIQSITRLKELREIVEEMAEGCWSWYAPQDQWECHWCDATKDGGGRGLTRQHDASCPVTRLAALRKEEKDASLR